MGVAMRSFDLVTRGNSLAFCEYVVKCLVGVSIGYLLMKTFPRESGQYYWLLISVVLSITHDNNSKVALDRMRGNVIGSLVGFASTTGCSSRLCSPLPTTTTVRSPLTG